MESAVVTEAELVEIGLIVATASMVGSEQESLEVADSDMYPVQVSDLEL